MKLLMFLDFSQHLNKSFFFVAAHISLFTCSYTSLINFITYQHFLMWGWFFIRKMHYPPETASVMLIAQMIATVLQVSITIKQQSATTIKWRKKKTAKLLKIFFIANQSAYCTILVVISSVFYFFVCYTIVSWFCFQAPDPKKMQNIYESFCHSVVNKGQQIVHKLLGDQFKVSWQQYVVVPFNETYDVYTMYMPQRGLLTGNWQAPYFLLQVDLWDEG